MHKLAVTLIVLLIACPLWAQKADYRNNVVRKGNSVYLDGFKTLKQKGPTCNIYSAVMILRYYGYTIHSKELMTTSNEDEYRGVKFLKARLDEKGFIISGISSNSPSLMEKKIRITIDSGIPVRWSCNMLLSPYAEERPKDKTENAGHARVITGYKFAGEKITAVIYADSWGKEQLNKTMSFSDAIKMTKALSVIYPKYLDPATIAQIDPPLNQNPKQTVPPPKRKKLPASTASSNSNEY